MTNTDSETSGASKRRGPGRLNFLHGASIVCFILAFVILWFGDTSTAILPAFDELIYVVIFTALGATLLGLGFNLTKVEKQMLTSRETVRLPQILVEDETSRAPELSPDSTHGQAEEIVPPAESLVQVQIRDESCETHLEKFDVTRPKHIVDCQC